MHDRYNLSEAYIYSKINVLNEVLKIIENTPVDKLKDTKRSSSSSFFYFILLFYFYYLFFYACFIYINFLTIIVIVTST